MGTLLACMCGCERTSMHTEPNSRSTYACMIQTRAITLTLLGRPGRLVSAPRHGRPSLRCQPSPTGVVTRWSPAPRAGSRRRCRALTLTCGALNLTPTQALILTRARNQNAGEQERGSGWPSLGHGKNARAWDVEQRRACATQDPLGCVMRRRSRFACGLLTSWLSYWLSVAWRIFMSP